MHEISGINFLLNSLRRKLFRFVIKYSKPFFLNFKDHISEERMVNGVHDEDLVNSIVYFNKKGYSDFLIDIGANIGLISCSVGKDFKKIFCYEPNLLIFKILEANVKSFLNIRNVILFNFALGKKKQKATLYVPKLNWGGAFILNKYQSYSKKLLSNKDGYKKFNKENYLLQKISIEQTKKIFNKLFKSKIKKKEKGIIKIDAEGMDLVILRDILGSKVNVSNLIIIFENFSSKVDLKKIINDSKKKLYFYKIERNRKIEKFPFKFYSWILMIIFGSRMIISQVKDINNLQGNIIISTQNYKDKLK
jgi:FkbM family methyltransferase